MKLFKRHPQPTNRQRILGGQLSAPTPYLYRAKRAELNDNTGRQVQRKLARPKLKLRQSFWFQRFGLVILLGVALISLVSVLSLSATAKVVPLASSSQVYLHSQAEYQAAASKLLASSIWNRNKITIDTAHVSQQLTAQFPELSAVSITLPLLAHRPLVYLQPAQPALVLVSATGSFVIDTTGKALLRSETTASFGHLGLTVVTDQSGLHAAIGQPALTANDVDFILTTVTELAARHIAPSTMVLPPSSSELDVYIAGQPYFVKFNLHADDARQQAGTYLATLAKLQSSNITPSQYIDVRVDGRAYYQ